MSVAHSPKEVDAHRTQRRGRAMAEPSVLDEVATGQGTSVVAATPKVVRRHAAAASISGALPAPAPLYGRGTAKAAPNPHQGTDACATSRDGTRDDLVTNNDAGDIAVADVQQPG